ncbi:non-ribosomal peptide synthetase [Aliikangiella coralliicola]|uniref:Amino acid adenylation domain-containing protein n=1 Tax=Aliikangiella coralliicola TaxID=2592383 RepID=A0A545TV47_9GAMM|nr:non-ribosomal peptide synthetase [Aliikangiella coralliicola]TQV81087.1 amino acid adenylation domain-containing protein [Aliikangiella coralliicola]
MLSKDISEPEISRLSPQQARLSSFSSESRKSLMCECEWEMPWHSSLESLQTQLVSRMEEFEIFRTKIQRHANGENVQVIAPQVQMQLELSNEISVQELLQKKESLRRNTIESDDRRVGLYIYQSSEKLCGIYFVAPPEIVDLETVQLLARSIDGRPENCIQSGQEGILQYADLSEWLNQLQDEELGKEGLKYWRKLDCPTIGSQPLLDGKVLKSEPHFSSVVTADYLLSCDNFSDQSKLNEDLFLSIWVLCIAKLSSCERVSVGKLCSGRTLDDLKDAIGNLSLTLPISFEFDWMSTFEEFLNNITATVSEGEQYQECFRWNELKSADASNASSYCFNSFEFHDLDSKEQGIASTKWIKAIFQVEPYLLKCSIKKYNQKTYLSFSYNPDLYFSETIEHLKERYIKVLNQVRSNFNVKLSQLDLTLPWERENQQNWNLTSRHFEQLIPFHQLFEKQAGDTPENTAVVFQEHKLSYTELNAKANQFARLLIDRGVSLGDYVGVSLGRSIDLVVALLGILKAGAAYVPIDPEYPAKRISYIADNSAIKLTIVNSRSGNLFNFNETLNLDDIGEQIKKYPNNNLQLSVLSEQAAYTIYTSGSTGVPKGVVISHRSLYNYVKWAGVEYELAEGNGSLVHSSISFDLTVTSLLAPLSVGQSVILIPEEEGIEGLINRLSKNNNYTLLKVTPSHLEMLNAALSHENMKNAVRVIVVGGEALSWHRINPWLINNPGMTIVNEYGPTEATVGCCIEKIRQHDPALTGMVPIGKPIHNTKLHVLDQSQNEVPIGVIGELYIEGMGLALEYHNRPDMTEKAFILMGRKADQKLYRTGDLAKYLEDGRLSFEGRCDEQVKLRGYRVELGEIEAILQNSRGVEEVVVRLLESGNKKTGIQNSETENIETPQNGRLGLVAYIVKSEVKIPDLFTTLKRRLAESIPEYMIPVHWVALDFLPLNKHGKLDKEKLPLPQNKQAYVSARTNTEQALVNLWQRFLGAERIGVKDNYFELGGDSIRSISLISAAREQGIVFTLNQLFSNPTIAELVQVIGESNEAEEECHTLPFEMITLDCRARLPDTVEDAYPLTTLQQGMIYHNQFYEDEKLYHDIFSYRLMLPENLKVDHLVIRKAYRHILRKHPVLRTTFSLSEFEHPLQLVHKRGNEESLVIRDLKGLNDERQQAEIELMIQREKETGFDISELPLVRCFIHLLSDREIQFSISFHHSIIDGWSDAILLTELLTAIISLSQEKELPERTLSSKFSDFVKLELSALDDPEFKQFWRDKLKDLSYTSIPALKNVSRNKVTSKVHSQQIVIEEPVSNNLKAIAKTIGVPLKTLLLTAHMRVLNLIAAQDDITTCLVSAGRPVSEDGDQVLGLFINSIPLRIKFGGLRKATWRKLIEETFSEENQCMKYRRYPYGKMKTFTGLDSVSDALFYFTDYHNLEGIYQQTGIKLLETRPYERSSFPLVVHFNIDPESKLLTGEVECNASQFTAEQNECYSLLFAELLEEISQSVDCEFDSVYSCSTRQYLESELCAKRGSVFYSDLIQWRKDYWLNQPGSKKLSYWEKRLSNCPKPPHLPLVGKSYQVKGFIEKSVASILESDLSKKIESICNEYQISDLMLFECLFSILLCRHGNEDKVLIRRVENSLNVKASDALVLKLISTIAIRTDINSKLSFTALIKKHIEESKRDLPYRDLSFESIIAHMKDSNSREELSNCRIFLNLDHKVTDPEVSQRVIYLPGQQEKIKAKFNLWLSIQREDNENKYNLSLAYNGALYSESGMQLIVDGFALLLHQISANADRNVYSYSILPHQEERRMFARSCNEEANQQHELCVHQLFEKQAGLHPERVAVVEQELELSYRQLNDKANRLANYLVGTRMVKPGEIVGLFLSGSTSFVTSSIALLKAGCAFLPMDPDYPASRIEYMVEDANLAVIITDQELAARLPIYSGKVLCIDEENLQGELQQSCSEIINLDTAKLDHEKLAYVIYTSGSTGKPKGVMVKHGHLSGHIKGMMSFYEYSKEDRVLQFSTVGVDATQEQIFCALSAGASLCMYNQGIMQGSDFDYFCSENNITILDLPPAYISALFEEKSSPFEYLRNDIRLLILGGERLSLQTYQHLKKAGLSCRVVNAYGPTETVITSLAHGFFLNQTISENVPSVPIGRAMKGREMYVLNKEYALVPDGVSGELFIGGKYLSSGYLNRPELTDDRFVKNPFSQSSNDYMYKTGDIVRWCDSDNLCFITRTDDQVSIRGFRVELSEIENEICNHPLVSSGVVLLRSDQTLGDKLVAYIVLEPEQHINVINASETAANDQETNKNIAEKRKVSNELELSDSLRGFLQRRLADYMIPNFYVFVDAFPLTPSGKIDREQLPELNLGSADDTYIPPRNELENILCSVCRQVLKVDRVGINSNFFHLGGDSLSCLQFVSRLREKKIYFNVRDVFDTPTISKLSEKVGAASVANENSSKSHQDGDRFSRKITKRITVRSSKVVRKRNSTDKLVLKIS